MFFLNAIASLLTDGAIALPWIGPNCIVIVGWRPPQAETSCHYSQ